MAARASQRLSVPRLWPSSWATFMPIPVKAPTVSASPVQPQASARLAASQAPATTAAYSNGT